MPLTENPRGENYHFVMYVHSMSIIGLSLAREYRFYTAATLTNKISNRLYDMILSAKPRIASL